MPAKSHHSDLTPIQTRRLKGTLIAFAFCTAILLLRIGTLASSHTEQREKLLRQSQSEVTLQFPGLRGAIRDKDGVLLAYSKRRLTLCWTIPQDDSAATSIWLLLAERQSDYPCLPEYHELENAQGKTLLIAENVRELTPELWTLLTDSSTGLKLSFHFDRILPYPELQHAIGTTSIDPNTRLEIGTGGIEQECNHTLQAKITQCGLLQHNRKVVIDIKQFDGQDVILPFTRQQLTQKESVK